MSKEYDEFMNQYEKDHRCCPKCGSEKYITTLVGYVLDMNNKESYKDRNRCTCMDCGDIHITHDRIKKLENKKAKVSFDFDSTLDRDDVQKYASELIERGFEVWITTSRFPDEYGREKGWWWIEKNNQYVYEVSDRLGIKREHISYTAMVDKWEELKKNDFIFHLDDDEVELDGIKENIKCEGVWIEVPDWKDNCELAIINYLKED